MFRAAKELGVVWKLRSEPSAARLAAVDDFVSRVDSIYLSLDLDVINQAFAPGVSAPAALGWTPAETLEILQCVISSRTVVCIDIAELNPAFDVDGRTARLAAGLIYEMVKVWVRP